MKIYTKTGDEGKTSLIGGSRVNKAHIRIEAYGTVDELNSWIGVIRDNANESHASSLIRIQNVLFTLGSLLAQDPEKKAISLPTLSEDEISWLETEIDEMDKKLPEIRNFVLPGGHSLVSFTHVSRTICRRSERKAVELSEVSEVSGIILKYLNRLSDYLFTLSRYFSNELQATEIPWKSK